MAHKAFNKEIVRSITRSPGRFVAIFAIVALGVGFYAGLRMTAPDMRLAADAFYDETNLMDVRVVSTLGMSADDAACLEDVDGVEHAMPAYEADVIADIGGEPYTVRVHSLPSGGQASMNDVVVEEGRMPKAPGECVMSADRIMGSPLSVGDAVTVTEMGDPPPLKATEYEVVGLVHSPYYASSASMGSSSLGSGVVEQFMYVSEDDFSDDYPVTEVYLSVPGARELVSGSDAYQALVDDAMANVKAIAAEREAARLAEVKAEAQEELDEAKSELATQRADTETRLAEAEAELAAAKAQLDESEAALAAGRRQRAAGATELESRRSAADAAFADAQAQLDAHAAELEQGQAALDSQAAALDASWSQAAAEGITPGNIAEKISQAEQALSGMSEGAPGRDMLEAALAKMKQLEAGQAAYDEAKATLAEGARQLEAAKGELASQRDFAKAQLAAAQAKLDASGRDLAEGARQLESGNAQYENGLAQLQASRAQAELELADAEAKIAEAQAGIDDLESPEWLVMDRTKNYGAESFDMDAGRVDSIAQVFPFVFFLVAALVALTSMTRMVDEERMQIGTLKALGYSRRRIASKYMLYAGAASVGGSVVGIALLSFTLPAIIMSAYSIVYAVPTAGLAIDWPIAALATVLGVCITLGATAFASASTLREPPAALMLPKAPKAGSRILFERVRPLWDRLSFLWKVTCRNIFRYKKRLFMTVAGIAGCTALLLTGFGLQDSINDIIDKHYGELIDYNAVIAIDPTASDEERTAIEDRLSDPSATSKKANVLERPMVATGERGTLATQLVVPENPEALAAVWKFRDRLTHDDVELGGEGAIVTEKLAARFGLDVGDAIRLAEQDDMGNATNEVRELRVSGIAENYVGHAVILSPKAYEAAFGSAPAFDTIYADTLMPEDARAAFAAELQALPGIKTVSFNDETIETYRTALKSVNMVVVVLIVAAALLAFIVLYNLTNINIAERMREIATLKVLGFTRGEIYRYIFREMLILSAIGGALGLLLGVMLENFVVTTAEVDAVMFGRDVHWSSFVASFLCTMAFAAFVALTMRRKLDRVDMVESLKSNE